MKKLFTYLLFTVLALITTECKVSNVEPLESININTNPNKPLNLILDNGSSYEIADKVYIIDLADTQSKIISFTNNQMVFRGKPLLKNAKDSKNGRVSAEIDIEKGFVVQFTHSKDGLKFNLSSNIGLTIKILDAPIQREYNGTVEITVNFELADLEDVFNHLDVSGSVKFGGNLTGKWGYLKPSESSVVYVNANELSAGIKTFAGTIPINFSIQPSIKLVWSRATGLNIFDVKCALNFDFSASVTADLVAKISKEFEAFSKDLPPINILIGPIIIPIKQKLKVLITPEIEAKVNITGELYKFNYVGTTGIMYNAASTREFKFPNPSTPEHHFLENLDVSISGKFKLGVKPVIEWSPPSTDDAKAFLKEFGITVPKDQKEEDYSLYVIKLEAGVEFAGDIGAGCKYSINGDVTPSSDIKLSFTPSISGTVKLLNKTIFSETYSKPIALNFTNFPIINQILPCNPTLQATDDNFKSLLRLKGFPIYEGSNPPMLVNSSISPENDNYLWGSPYLENSNYTHDDYNLKVKGYPRFPDYKFRFFSQNQSSNIVKVRLRHIDVREELANGVTGSFVSITGTGNNFTIIGSMSGFMKGAIVKDATMQPYNNFFAISGTKNGEKISDLNYAIFTKDKTVGLLGLPASTFRFFKSKNDALATTQF